MHRPQGGKAAATTVQKEDPHFKDPRVYTDLPVFVPNVDPKPTPTVHAAPSPHKQIPITHPDQRETPKEGYLIAHKPPSGKHAAPGLSHE